MSSSSISGRRAYLVSLVGLALFFGACSVGRLARTEVTTHDARPSPSTVAESAGGALIEIQAGGPADTVRAFYRLLREKKFREAMFLTNMRPAIESLTDAELGEFSLDFAALAGDVPAEIEINGEIITGAKATVTANFPDPESGKKKLETIKLFLADKVWVIQTADEEAAKRIKAEGSRYFFNLRIKTHEDEAVAMLERVAKAQTAYSLQNGGAFAEVDRLVSDGLLPADITSSDSTGYNFRIAVAGDKRSYSATATPAVYKKSGVRSFLLRLDEKGVPRLSSKDNGGKPLGQ